MPNRQLTALPVYNEVDYVSDVLDQVTRYSPEVLVINDGSSDGTKELLDQRNDIHVVHHEKNQGYGRALVSAFDYAIEQEYDVLVTIDCDGQHEPQRIPQFFAASESADIVSGSRYLREFEGDTPPPPERLWVNQKITAELKTRLGLTLTDSFCGFKAYSAAALRQFSITEFGYGMPLQLWVQAVAAKMRIIELPVPLIYLDEERSFGGSLDDSKVRLEYYYEILNRSIQESTLADCPDVRGSLCGGG